MMYGTVQSNRVDLPADLKALKDPKGTYAFGRERKSFLLKYHDKEVVLVLSTMHDATTVPTRKRDGKGHQVEWLAANHSYNQFRDRVEKNNSMVSTHSSIRHHGK